MPGLVLDTTVLIDALRGQPAVERLRELRRQRLPLLTTSPVLESARGDARCAVRDAPQLALLVAYGKDRLPRSATQLLAGDSSVVQLTA